MSERLLEHISNQLQGIENLMIKLHEDMLNVSGVMAETLEERRRVDDKVEAKRQARFFYFGVFLGIALGVVGNFFVSLWFQQPTEWNIMGLIVSGFILFLMCAASWYEALKHR